MQGIRCAMCEHVLAPDAFAPSHCKDGAWCRACRKNYMKNYNARHVPLSPCRDCGDSYDRWNEWKKPGAAHRRCHNCYLAYTRNRQTPRKRQLKSVPLYGRPGQSKEWLALKVLVIGEESHCGFCGELVDKTLTGLDRMGPTVDHIIPTALGGSNARDNLRLAHRSCNAIAGARQQVERAALLRSALWMGERLGA